MSAFAPIASEPGLAWLVNTMMFLGAIATMLCILSLLAYALSAIQAWLPLWASALITGAIAVLALRGLFDVKLWLVQQGAKLYPSGLRAEYLEWVGALQPILVFVVTAGTSLLLALSMYVQIRGTIGFLRKGNNYLSSKFFKAWSSPVEPIRHVWNI